MAAYWILALTVGTAIVRPTVGALRIQPHIAAAAGAALMILAGILPLPAAAGALAFLAEPVLTIASLMAITLVAERAGLFQLVAWWVARCANGDAHRLLAYLFAAGAVTGALFTNDAAVLIFTPLAFRLVEDAKTPSWSHEQKIPFYFAVLFVANLVGSFVTSNPINVIVSRWFGIGFVDYARWMMLPSLTSVIVSYAGLRLFFRKTLPDTCKLAAARPAIPRQWLLVTSTGVLALVLAGFGTGEFTGLSTSVIAASGAAILLPVYNAFGGRPAEVVRGIGWDVIIFMIGMFLVSLGLREAGLTRVIGDLVLQASSRGAEFATFATGFTAAGLSAVMNNHPVAGTMAMAIGDLDLGDHLTRLIAFAALIGGDLGPKMLPIGSLAALMWFRMLSARGVRISYLQYVRLGVPVTLAAILLAVLVLNTQYALAGLAD